MRDETFVRIMKEVYPMAYESLRDDFERVIRRKAAYTRRMKNE